MVVLLVVVGVVVHGGGVGCFSLLSCGCLRMLQHNVTYNEPLLFDFKYLSERPINIITSTCSLK